MNMSNWIVYFDLQVKRIAADARKNVPEKFSRPRETTISTLNASNVQVGLFLKPYII